MPASRPRGSTNWREHCPPDRHSRARGTGDAWKAGQGRSAGQHRESGEPARAERRVLIITHCSRILAYLSPDRIDVTLAGRIVESGGPELADKLEDAGYDAIPKRLGIAVKPELAQKRPADLLIDAPFDV